MSTKIKICGITNLEDAKAAVHCGADYIGLIFVPNTARHVSLETAATIIDALDDEVSIVGVFRNADPQTVDNTVTNLGLSFVQYHGNEPPESCAYTSQTVIKSIEVTDVLSISSYTPYVDFLLFDRPKDSSQNDPIVLVNAIAQLIEDNAQLPPYFFAGGLTPENVSEVVKRLNPFAVDVASGVESSPGKKDLEKLKQFCKSVKETSLCSH